MAVPFFTEPFLFLIIREFGKGVISFGRPVYLENVVPFSSDIPNDRFRTTESTLGFKNVKTVLSVTTRDDNDHRSYAHNLSSREIKIFKA